MPTEKLCRFLDTVACSSGKLTEKGRHSFIRPHLTDIALHLGQNISVEAESFDGKPETHTDDKLLSFLNQL